MGLDMYAWAVPTDWAVDDDKIAEPGTNGRPERGVDGSDLTEIYYWRKHHDLHGWMEELYRSRGGDAESFNCIPIRIYSDDLDALEMDVLKNLLPKTRGFFFGDNPPDEESIKQDLEFVAKARWAIADGLAVYYDSWW